ncbi:MAG: polynucleotide adenylyltransferase PcnB [Cardiobacteriaceae bacterium]|nr:polynucleotide adenylyltransferase PcnB [Cardiobacteriaceae bacterium]
MQKRIYSLEEHGIDRANFSNNAVKICEKLHQYGYQAYFVGGCLRDCLFSEKPKDVDIVTNATPEEIVKVFRSGRIIGKRFKIVHITMGRELFEVVTFRRDGNIEMQASGISWLEKKELYKNNSRVVTQTGQLVRDNDYGTFEDDVLRRDFTINSLYYDPETEELIDCLDAVSDLKQGIIRFIGQAEKRCEEDPVRMLRAARIAAKLGMELDKDTENAIKSSLKQLQSVSRARLLFEIEKLFLSGYGEKSFIALRKYGLFAELFPDVERIFHHPNQQLALYAEKLICSALINSDERVQEGLPVTIAFVLAAFYWSVYQLQYTGVAKNNANWHSAMHESVDIVMLALLETISIPVQLRSMIRDIWVLQAHLEIGQNRPKKANSLLYQQRFSAAMDFLELRQQAGEEKAEELVNWWHDFLENVDELGENQPTDELEQVLPIDKKSKTIEMRKPRRRRRRK